MVERRRLPETVYNFMHARHVAKDIPHYEFQHKNYVRAESLP